MSQAEVSIPVFIMREQGSLYGAFADMSEADCTECVVRTSIQGTGEDFGYLCDIDKGMDAIGALGQLYDSCELMDLLMVFFTAGLRAGVYYKEALEHGPTEEPTSDDIAQQEAWEERERADDNVPLGARDYRVHPETDNVDDEPHRRTHN